jgi:predicted metal-dependent hydrolase
MNSSEYTLKINRRAKRISVTVKRDGSCIVSVPFRRVSVLQNMLISKAEKFASSKKDWIETQREKYRNLQEKINKLRKLREAENPGMSGYQDQTADSANSNSKSKVSEKELKTRTLNIVMERLAYFNKFYNFKYKDVRVKKVSSRWGSCSRRGNLNFSHKLGLLLPQEIDYVVVHELCHLAEFNHGPNFWKLVERTIPNYLQIRKGMKVAMF